MNKKNLFWLIFVTTALTLTQNSFAAVDCSTIGNNGTITSDTNLTDDLTTSGNCLTIGANNITLDCQGHSLSGSDVGIGIDFSIYDSSVVKNCTVQNFYTGIELEGIPTSQATDNNVTQNTTINNTNGILLSSTSSAPATQRNNIWNNTVHDRIYTPNTGIDNSFCVNDVGNNYIGGATGPTCSGWYPYSSMTVVGLITLMPGTFSGVNPFFGQ